MGDTARHDGFAAAVGLCGEVLARHFPPRADNRNELPDHLILPKEQGALLTTVGLPAQA